MKKVEKTYTRRNKELQGDKDKKIELVPSSHHGGFENLVSEKRLDEVGESIQGIERMMYPPNTLPSSGFIKIKQIPSQVLTKIDKLFEAPKFHMQKVNLDMYFNEGLSTTKIARTTRQNDSNVRRSLRLAVNKIRKKLTEEEYDHVKHIYDRYGKTIHVSLQRVNYEEFEKGVELEMIVPVEVDYVDQELNYEPYTRIPIGEGRNTNEGDYYPDGTAVRGDRYTSPTINYTPESKNLPTPRNESPHHVQTSKKVNEGSTSTTWDNSTNELAPMKPALNRGEGRVNIKTGEISWSRLLSE